MRAITSRSRTKRIVGVVPGSVSCSLIALFLVVLLALDGGLRYRGRWGGSRAPPGSRPNPEMTARTRSAVRNVSERPAVDPAHQVRSPSAILPNLVGLSPVRSRKVLTRVLKYSSSVSMSER